MHLKIQGGGTGRMANQGSSSSLISYLQHEDLKNIKEGKPVEPFFSHYEDNVKADDIIDRLDNNKRKLCKKDAKFYMLTLSPSKEELGHIGKTPEEQAKRLKEYVRKELMQEYAESFNKGLNAKDIMYFGKVHYDRKQSPGEKGNLHIHIVVSRKTANGKLRISPKTNHKNTKNGPVKGGFSRVEFFENAEKRFDRHFVYQRRKEEQFTYKKRYKKANPKELERLIKEKYRYNKQLEQQREKLYRQLKEKGFTENQIDRLFKGKTLRIKNSVKDKQLHLEYVFYLKMNEDGEFELQSYGAGGFEPIKPIVPQNVLNMFKEAMAPAPMEDLSEEHKKKKKRRRKFGRGM